MHRHRCRSCIVRTLRRLSAGNGAPLRRTLDLANVNISIVGSPVNILEVLMEILNALLILLNHIRQFSHVDFLLSGGSAEASRGSLRSR